MHLKLLLVCTVAATVVNAIGGAPAIIAQLESDLATLKTLCGRSVPAPAVQRAAGGKTGQVALAVTGPTGGAAGGDAGGTVSGALTFGKCPSGPSIEFSPGLDGRKATEFSFRPQNPIAQFSGQATALNPSIIINFLCDRLNDRCQDKVNEQKCRDFKAKVDASGDRSGKVADDFNALFGVKSNFAAVGTAGAATSGAAPVSTAGAATSGAAGGASKFGLCPSGPSIEFAPGLDGRKATEFSFRPQNPIAQFSGQATALNPSIIINFLCDRLNDKCQDKVDEQKCRDFKAKVDASGDRSGKVADDFNALFGVKSNFAAVGAAGAATSGAAPVSTAGAATSGAAGGASKFGLCPSGPSIEFAPGLDGRKATEFSFRPQKPIAQFSGQATALNPSIIINFLCDRLNDKCQDKVDEQKCRDFKAKVDASGDRSGKVADDFNALFGVKSNFAAVGAAGAATSGAAPVSTGGAAISGAAGGASKFGLCPSGPSIEFAPGLDSRKATEFSFRPQNPIAQFSGQATALNPSIIVNFLCDRLNDKCQDKVDEQKCRNFKAKIDASGDRSGKVADDFNALFGVKSNFSAVGPK